MSDGHDNPFAMDATPADPHNPYAAPLMMDAVAQDSDLELASRWARLGGAIVDGLTMIPAGLIVFFLMASNLNGMDPSVTALLGAVLAPVWYLVLNGYLLAKRGQTIGKIVAGTRIVDAETNELVPFVPLLFKRWVLVQIVSMIPYFGGLFNLVNILLIFRENRRCLHDNFAGTKVIKVTG